MDGLTKEEVEERVKKGQINTEVDSKTKSTKDIILSNTINYFNILNIILAILILFSGQIKNILFLIVVVCNSSITIFQEIRSKRMVECLTLLSKNKITVLRDGKKEDINTNEIVLDDVLFVETGEQLPVDCIILDGHLEMDESNLTGESETVDKNKDDEVYSGSIVVSGTAKLLVKKVGMDSYTNKISSSAKVDRKYPSKLRDTMDGILKIVTIAIIPVGVLIFLKNKFIFKLPFEDLILKSTAPLVGMIPEGLILLTSVALAVSVYNLGKKKILIQQLYCTESLARVDVLCVDKTGTITEGRMEVVETIGDIEDIMPSYLSAFDYENASDKAMIEKFSKKQKYKVLSKIDFSSARKYSAVTFEEIGTYALGAFEFIVKNPDKKDADLVEKYIKDGFRVLVLAKFKYKIEKEIPEDCKIQGFIILSDVVRENTSELFEFFRNEGVEVKIISGDNPFAVGAIAKKAGLKEVSAIDVSKLNDEELKDAVINNNIFGRVSPEQKKFMVNCLQENGKTVAMTGDGVNDVLALKQANVSIAMAEGSDAAKQISNIVLLENNFRNLYDILMEGRRVINNIQKVSTLFLTKTFLSVIFALISILTSITFPFIPIQLTLISNLTIGIPGFFLTLEKSKKKIEAHFMKDVLLRSITSAVVLAATVLVVGLILHAFYGDGSESRHLMSTMATYLAFINGINLIVIISKPLDRYKHILVSSLVVIMLAVVLFVPGFFQLVSLNLTQITILSIAATCMVLSLIFISKVIMKKLR